MENYLSKESLDILDQITSNIVDSSDYQNTLKYRELIRKDKDLFKLINKVKTLEKKYVRSNYDDSIKEELDTILDTLNKNSLYIKYNYYLERVNERIELVKNSINNYFDSVVDYDFK